MTNPIGGNSSGASSTQQAIGSPSSEFDTMLQYAKTMNEIAKKIGIVGIDNDLLGCTLKRIESNRPRPLEQTNRETVRDATEMKTDEELSGNQSLVDTANKIIDTLGVPGPRGSLKRKEGGETGERAKCGTFNDPWSSSSDENEQAVTRRRRSY